MRQRCVRRQPSLPGDGESLSYQLLHLLFMWWVGKISYDNTNKVWCKVQNWPAAMVTKRIYISGCHSNWWIMLQCTRPNTYFKWQCVWSLFMFSLMRRAESLLRILRRSYEYHLVFMNVYQKNWSHPQNPHFSNHGCVWEYAVSAQCLIRTVQKVRAWFKCVVWFFRETNAT